MRRLIVMAFILLLVYYIIPEVDNQENLIKDKEVKELAQELFSRSGNSREVKNTTEEKTKILDLTVDSDLTIISNLTAEDFDKMLEGTNLRGIGKSLENAERDSGVNGLYLMGLACLESSYGNSKFAKERNNLVGWNAVDNNPNKATYFKTKGECIEFVAYKLKQNYLTEGGCYYNGKTPRAIDVKYCTDKKHADKIINIINKLEVKLYEK